MSFRSVFLALVIGFGLVLAALVINAQRPKREVEQPTVALVRATGKCAECHARLQHSVVHEYEMSAHAVKNVTCLDCHQPAAGQEKDDHHSFVISKTVTSANCRSCHEAVYRQFLRSRHAAPSWAAVYGESGLTPEQVAQSEVFHPGASKRPANALVSLEGAAAMDAGCAKCHSIGKPNADGTIGTCTACHMRHTSSVAIARLPTTCGQCHMGPDHSQLEIFNESKHGLMFAAQKELLNLAAKPKSLSTRDMFVPTCATCHMSGLNGLNVTHDTTERLSYWLFAEISEKRPNYVRGQETMKDLCAQCHARSHIDQMYKEAEAVVEATNEKVKSVKEIVEGLKRDGLVGKQPFQTPLDFKYFDLWHYYGRTAKHGAFMGGADFAQWHGNYPLLAHTVEIKALAEELRRQKDAASK
jgi:hydroxylamine dehydrogenase